MIPCATCKKLFLDSTPMIGGVEGPRCADCHDKIEDDPSKDCGPDVIASIVGTCIGSYIRYGVTKNEVLSIVGGMYDAILDHARG